MAVIPPFKSLLIANRGEIAVRIARTCRVMGIRSIAVYSEPDAASLHVKTCDVAVSIGGISARDSYLRADKIIAAARKTGAQALHPGYGFLSENPEFAQACADAGVQFVGPSPRAMRAMGDKIAAKHAVSAVGVPSVPGFGDPNASAQRLHHEAQRIGVPLLVKAAAGGGGRGMRLVTDPHDFQAALEAAQREAQAAFDDGTVFLERFVPSPRHIEVQIIADQHGQCVTFAERECSIQRRYQKIVEESPSPAVDSSLREQLQSAAAKAAQSVGYTNAGTVEFLLDSEHRFYFLEMNARLQVEHPVTEAVTGIDLVREQINVAAGMRLQVDEALTQPRGHAIEMRLYAEDPANDFLPSSGAITVFSTPEGPGIRNDVAVQAGAVVTTFYDPMLAKLIVSDRTREHCIQRLQAALEDYAVGGVATNLPLLRRIAHDRAFARGDTATDYLERHHPADKPSASADDRAALIAAAGALQYLCPQRQKAAASTGAAGRTAANRWRAAAGPWRTLGAWRHAPASRDVFFQGSNAPVHVRRNYEQDAWECRTGRSCALIEELQPGLFVFRLSKETIKFAAWQTSDGIALSWQAGIRRFSLPKAPAATQDGAHRPGAQVAAGSVTAPMSGTIVKVLAKANERVNSLQVLIVMEAMKMEHSIVAPYAGLLRLVRVSAGDAVAAGDVLVEIAEP